MDYYHASEHLSNLSKVLSPDDEEHRKAWLKFLTDMRWQGQIPSLLTELHSLRVRRKKKVEVEKAISYFEKNKERMRYAEFRNKGLFIGSGVVEAGCKSVNRRRLKRCGMHWTVRSGNALIALRCCIESRKFEDYWQSRGAA